MVVNAVNPVIMYLLLLENFFVAKVSNKNVIKVKTRLFEIHIVRFIRKSIKMLLLYIIRTNFNKYFFFEIKGIEYFDYKLLELFQTPLKHMQQKSFYNGPPGN